MGSAIGGGADAGLRVGRGPVHRSRAGGRVAPPPAMAERGRSGGRRRHTQPTISRGSRHALPTSPRCCSALWRTPILAARLPPSIGASTSSSDASNSALSDMALGPDGEGLKLIDAHVAELAEHVDAIRQQLGRLDAMDGQLCELTRTLEERQPPAAGSVPLGEDAVAALVDSAAERAASLVAASLPAQAGGPGPGDGRIEALEALLQDYIAERRRSDEVSAGILHTIEDALVRILDRVEAMEAANSSAQAHTEGDARDSDAMEAETDRLAEAYAAGARVLGQQLLEPSLHAADYVATDRREEPTEVPLDMLPQLAADEPAPLEEEQTRQELRASALRAKLKAQATHQEPPTTGDAGLDQPATESKPRSGTGGPGRGRRRERAATAPACCWAEPWLCCSGPASWRSTRSSPPHRPPVPLPRSSARSRRSPRRSRQERSCTVVRRLEGTGAGAAAGAAPSDARRCNRRFRPASARAYPAPLSAADGHRSPTPDRRHAGHAVVAGCGRRLLGRHWRHPRGRRGRDPIDRRHSQDEAGCRRRRRLRAVRDRHPLRRGQGRGPGPRPSLCLVRAGGHARAGFGPVPPRRLLRARPRRRAGQGAGQGVVRAAPPTRVMSAPCTIWAS